MTSNLRQEKQFGLALALISAGIAFWPLVDGAAPAWPWAVACFVLLLVTWRAAMLLSPVVKVWMRVGHFLGIVNTRILLGIAFFVVITPLAFIFKLLGRDPLRLRFNKLASYWLKNDKQWSPESFKNQF